MKHCLAAILLGLVLWGCAPEPEELKQARAAGMVTPEQQRQFGQRYVNQIVADRVAGELVYFKDPRTNLCFVYCSPYGISWVPEAAIPKEMLYIANTGNSKPPTKTTTQAEKVSP